jgi:hypothetical protein
MTNIGPLQAATIASEVYELENNNIEKAMKLSQTGLGIGNDFSVNSGSRFSGVSGPQILNSKTGFGYIAEGQGKRQGEVLIATRGTATFGDVWTDLNAGMQIGPNGCLVHAGFNNTFESFKGNLQQYFANKSPSVVHCVGHSLGGALATLVADYVSESKIAKASLYTFGSPRTGTSNFSSCLTQKLGVENIHRVHQIADVVPMLPIFPFGHVPHSSNDIRLNWNGWAVSGFAHLMKNYISAVKDVDGWNALRTNMDRPDISNQAEHWLESGGSGVTMFGAKSLWMIGKALAWIVKKATNIVVGSAITVGFTVLDKIAWLLNTGAAASLEVAGHVSTLIKSILKFLGRSVITVGKLTVSFLRWILSTLMTTLQNVATQSLNLIF